MSSFYGLLNNSALMLVLCVIYDTFNIHSIERKSVRDGITGIIVGAIAIAVMMTPWSLIPGVFFDTRWVLLSLCGLFFGFAPTCIAVVMAGAFRLYQGGAGGVVGTLVIVTTAVTGLGWRYWTARYRKQLGLGHLYLFGLSVQLVMLSCMAFMPAQMRLPIIKSIAPPILVMYPFLTMIVGLVLRRQEERRITDKALVREIQERHNAEKAARKSEAHLRTLIEIMPDLVWLKNPDGVFLDGNRKFETLYGISRAELIGKTDNVLVDEKRAERFRRDDREVMAAGRPSCREHTLVYAQDGRTEIVETIKTPMYASSGELIGVLGVGRDITGRKEGELALQKSKEEWEKTFNAITDIVSFQDTDFKILKINRAGCDDLGMAARDILGRQCYTLFQDRDQPCPGCPLTTTIETLKPHTDEVVNRHLGKTFLVSASPVFDRNGELTHITHVAKDITEKKRLEENLFQAQKMESIGTLAGGIAHDFNNILYAIMGFAGLAKEKLAAGEPADKDLDQIVRSGRRAADLVQHILTFSRKSDHCLSRLSPCLVIQEALEMLRASMPATVSIREDLDPGCPTILADPTNVHQIVINLCTNALHAMADQKGTLGIRLFQEEVCAGEYNGDAAPGIFVVLEVTDTGHGMDKAIQDKIFDPFFTTKEVGQGTGLGLSVIHGIVQDYNGFIQVSSQPGKGTCFRVYLPESKGGAPACEAADDTVSSPPLGRERILLVDDEPMIVELNRIILERREYQVTAVTESPEALELVRQDPEGFDLVITDQTMPDLPGAELAAEILAMNPHLPVILCTGHSSVVSREEALASGISQYLEKPINRQTLEKAVRTVLDRQR